MTIELYNGKQSKAVLCGEREKELSEKIINIILSVKKQKRTSHSSN